MQIFGLCIISVAFMIVGLIYLSKEQLVNIEEPLLKRISLIFTEHKKRCIYILLMTLVLCGLAVWLTITYPSNTFIMNLKLLTLISVLSIVNVTDMREHIIPNKVILASLILRIIYYIVELFTTGSGFWTILKSDMLALLIVVFFFVIGVLIMKNGIGMGDIKLMIVMCLLQGISGVISSLFYSLLIAFVIAVVMLILRKKTRKDALAFAPSVLIGTLISVFISGM